MIALMRWRRYAGWRREVFSPVNLTLRALDPKPVYAIWPRWRPHVGSPVCINIVATYREVCFVLQCLAYKSRPKKVITCAHPVGPAVQVTLSDNWLRWAPWTSKDLRAIIDWMASEILHQRRSWLSGATRPPLSWYARAGRSRRRRRYLRRTYPLPSTVERIA